MKNSPQYTPPPVDFSQVKLSLGGSAGRPVGISIISLYYIASSLLGLLVLAWSTSPLRTPAGVEGARNLGGFDFVTSAIQEQQNRAESFLLIIVMVAVVVAGLDLAVGLGLWRMRIWAYYLALVFSFFALALNLCDWIAKPLILAEVVGATMNLAILLYLARPQTRQSFTGGVV